MLIARENAVGTERIGRYEVLRKIATGGMADLFLAKQVGLEGFEKIVAIKRILPHLAYDQEFVNMFRDEARIVAMLSHPNIVQIYDLGKAEESYFIAMEYIPGRNLSSIAKKCRAKGFAFPPVFVARCVAQACEGLYYAHTRRDPDGVPLDIVHRDVSPQNILLSFSGGVKLVDFGIAKAASKIAHTRAGVLKGKYAYMSPEQIRGETIDARSDLFAVGIVLYELLCGCRPFERESSIQTLRAIVQEEPLDCQFLNPQIPDALAAIIRKALAKTASARFQTAREVQIALEDFAASTGMRANNMVISEWASALFAEELSPLRGGTVILPGHGAVVLPEADASGAVELSSSIEPEGANPEPPERRVLDAPVAAESVAWSVLEERPLPGRETARAEGAFRDEPTRLEGDDTFGSEATRDLDDGASMHGASSSVEDDERTLHPGDIDDEASVEATRTSAPLPDAASGAVVDVTHGRRLDSWAELSGAFGDDANVAGNEEDPWGSDATVHAESNTGPQKAVVVDTGAHTRRTPHREIEGIFAESRGASAPRLPLLRPDTDDEPSGGFLGERTIFTPDARGAGELGDGDGSEPVSSVTFDDALLDEPSMPESTQMDAGEDSERETVGVRRPAGPPPLPPVELLEQVEKSFEISFDSSFVEPTRNATPEPVGASTPLAAIRLEPIFERAPSPHANARESLRLRAEVADSRRDVEPPEPAEATVDDQTDPSLVQYEGDPIDESFDVSSFARNVALRPRLDEATLPPKKRRIELAAPDAAPFVPPAPHASIDTPSTRPELKSMPSLAPRLAAPSPAVATSTTSRSVAPKVSQGRRIRELVRSHGGNEELRPIPVEAIASHGTPTPAHLAPYEPAAAPEVPPRVRRGRIALLASFVLASAVAGLLFHLRKDVFLAGGGEPNLTIMTDPPGAGIFVNERRQSGETPATLHGLEPGATYQLRLERAGYLPVTKSVKIPADKSSMLVKVPLLPE